MPNDIALGRFKRMAQRSGEVWQGGVFRMPMWIDDPETPDVDPYRPIAALWISLRTGLLHVALLREEASPESALAALLAFPIKVKAVDARPAAIEVRDAALREYLTHALEGTGTDVRLVDRLPAVEEALAAFEASAAEGPRVAGLLEGPGLTVERLRGFAEAAALFYAARPWRHLTNEDLIDVAVPEGRVPPEMEHVVVLGHGGQEFGLGFFASRGAFEHVIEAPMPDVNRANGVTFGPLDALPFADVDAWERYDLPVAGPEAYPVPADLAVDRAPRRPDARELAFLEALLRGLADVTEDELDAGAWERRVASADGPTHLQFSLPLLLEAERDGQGDAPSAAGRLAPERVMVELQRFLDGRQFDSIEDVNEALAEAVDDPAFGAGRGAGQRPGATPLQEAQQLVYAAEDSRGRLRVKLARRALAISADCADAYRLLGELAADQDEALEYFTQAVDAGARAIGATAFESLAGEFWGHLETRPYMRARLALAGQLRTFGRHDEAFEHYRDMLRLNPGDNQGVRYILIAYLLEQERHDEAARLLEDYDGDIQAVWAYARALLRFRTDGDGPGARAALAEAVRVNPHVVTYLLDSDRIPWTAPPHFALGSPEEAAYAADELLIAFEDTAGARAWLRKAPRRRGGREAARKRGAKKRR